MKPPMLNRILDHLAYDGAFVRPANAELIALVVIAFASPWVLFG